MLNIALVGFGGIAKSAHFHAYTNLAKQGKTNLVAVCDICPEKFEATEKINIGDGNIYLPESVNRYTSWQEMFKKEKVDIIDICLPTYLHASVTKVALKNGFNVLCEKPMSLTYDICCEMIEAANTSGKKLMVGQCLRFDSKYRYLKNLVDNNTFGNVLSGTFCRLSAPPFWGWENWFLDFEKSRGCISDMHIHDLDIILHCFGEPKTVSALTQDVYGKKDIAHSTLNYGDFFIIAIGDWSQEGLPFSAEYRVAFEKATVDCKDGVVTVYPRGGEAYKADIINDDPYFNEIEFFVESIENDLKNTINPPEESAQTIRLVNALIKSSDSNGVFVEF